MTNNVVEMVPRTALHPETQQPVMKFGQWFIDPEHMREVNALVAGYATAPLQQQSIWRLRLAALAESAYSGQRQPNCRWLLFKTCPTTLLATSVCLDYEHNTMTPSLSSTLEGDIVRLLVAGIARGDSSVELLIDEVDLRENALGRFRESLEVVAYQGYITMTGLRVLQGQAGSGDVVVLATGQRTDGRPFRVRAVLREPVADGTDYANP